MLAGENSCCRPLRQGWVRHCHCVENFCEIGNSTLAPQSHNVTFSPRSCTVFARIVLFLFRNTL